MTDRGDIRKIYKFRKYMFDRKGERGNCGYVT